jgi:hypothetical protein
MALSPSVEWDWGSGGGAAAAAAGGGTDADACQRRKSSLHEAGYTSISYPTTTSHTSFPSADPAADPALSQPCTTLPTAVHEALCVGVMHLAAHTAQALARGVSYMTALGSYTALIGLHSGTCCPCGNIDRS